MEPPVVARPRRRREPVRRRLARAAHVHVGCGERFVRGHECGRDGRDAVGDARERAGSRERRRLGAGAVAPRAQAREHRQQCRTLGGGLGQHPRLEQLDVHFQLARVAGRAPQPARAAPRRPRLALGPRRRRRPHAQRRLEPARRDAQVVHGFGVELRAGPCGRGGERGGAPQQVERDGLGPRGRHGAQGFRVQRHDAGAGRPWASSAATRSQSLSEISSTLRVASSVVKA